MSAIPRLEALAARRPEVVLAAASAAAALLAWWVGVALASLWRPVGLWPLGAFMLGWLAYAPGIAGAGSDDTRRNAGRADTRGESRLRLLCALSAMVAVGLADLAHGGAWHAGWAVVAGVLVPCIASELLSRLASMVPPRGVGSVELRLLGAAIACAPIGAVLRSIQAPGGRGSWMSPDFVDLLFGDVIAATIFAPLAAALAAPLGARIEAARRARGLEAAGIRAPEPPPAVPGASRQSLILATGAIVACALASTALRAMGHEDLSRVVAVTHLLLGLLVARSVSGAPGATLLAANAFAMAATHTSAFAPATVDDVARAREIAALLLLGGIFSMQSILHSVSADSREAARALIRQAMRSDLSGLPNQRALARIVDALLSRPRRTRFWLVGVVLPDIARWSDLTDSAAAAELERSVAGRLRATFEPLGARVAHPSSGRFVLTIGDRVDGLGIRQRLRTTLGGQRFETSEQSIQLRYHAGMVEVPANADVGSDAVLTALSMALQRAANDPAGIHRATVSPALIDDYRTELRTIETVSRALNEGRIRLYAERIEPSVPRLHDMLHFEVLVRVEGDDGRMLQPKQFLPAIWHAGLHSKLDRLVFVRTVAYLAAHRALHDATHLCSINVCGPTLCDPEFPDYVKRCLAAHAVDPRRLMIEITESSAIADLELARAHVERLSEMGLAIALDDFGTGLATFDYLKRLRADVLKIDGSFIRKVVDDPLDREIVATIVRIARATGARTVAEWIETPEQRALATELGVDYLQGRLIASPVPIETLEIPGARTPQVCLVEEVATTVAALPVTYDHGQWVDRRGMPRPRKPAAQPAPRSPIASR
ncbi:MAG: GGDEF domain-containing phosphodiesterase [Burkholderiales bacterium]|nr:GGDEF domain-containing phosphodiesterase [Burkholderiales bacterium]